MRNIKFRAWDKLNKNWFNPSNTNDGAGLTFDGEIAFCSQSQFGYIDPKNKNRFIVQQFTGLLDKNGREIYEGDIVIHENPYSTSVTKEQGEIIFDKGAFWLRNESGDWYFDTSPIVIGNIFENPELCKIEK